MDSCQNNSRNRFISFLSWVNFLAASRYILLGSILACSTFIFVVASNAADFIENEKAVTIAGTFVDGDYEKFEDLLVRRSKAGSPTRGVVLVSHGGDVKTAMAIGRLIRKNWLITSTLGMFGNTNHFMCHDSVGLPPEILNQWNGQCTCDSACFLVWAAGVSRTSADGILGIHRPYFGTLTTANLAKPETGKNYTQVIDEVRNYLREMNSPDRYFEIMMTKNSTEVYRLSQAEVDEQMYSPLYEDSIIKGCGGIAFKMPKLVEAQNRRVELIIYNYDHNSKFVLSPEDQNLVSQFDNLFECQQKVVSDAQDSLQKQ